LPSGAFHVDASRAVQADRACPIDIGATLTPAGYAPRTYRQLGKVSGFVFERRSLEECPCRDGLAGTRFGPILIPKEPDSSNLMRLLNWSVTTQLRMPNSKKQSVCDPNAIRAWLRQGAKDN
jgi:hypothetical protein